jgi:hypothetical protein
MPTSHVGRSYVGGEGWEAVAVIQQGDGWWVLLKMPHEVGTY